jgi:hypothetical protein
MAVASIPGIVALIRKRIKKKIPPKREIEFIYYE